MHNRNRVINKLALVLICIVVLELVLIGHQVQPVKGIKKKIYLKKLKKLLPLFALVKPKKKIILLPIPIPIFKSQSSYHDQQPNAQKYHMHGQSPPLIGHHATAGYAPMMKAPPLSFMVMNTRPQSSGMMSQMPIDSQMIMSSSKDVDSIFTEPTNTSTTSAPSSSAPMSAAPPESNSQALAMSGPNTMTMTIHAKPDGGSNIELSTNIESAMSGFAGEPMGGALTQRPYGKWRAQSPAKQLRQQQPQLMQQLQLHVNHLSPSPEHYGEDPAAVAASTAWSALEPPGGEHYYSSPWANRSPPLISSTRMMRMPHKQNWSSPPPPPPQPLQARPPPATTSGVPFTMPMTSQRDWRPATSAPLRTHEPSKHQLLQQQAIDMQQQLNQALEMEELVPAGPAQEVPGVYRAPDGQLHIPLPPMSAANIEQEHEPLRAQPHDDQADEVQTFGVRPPESGSGEPAKVVAAAPTTKPKQRPQSASGKTPVKGGQTPVSGRLVSPTVKGKQQQKQSQKQGTKQDSPTSFGGY